MTTAVKFGTELGFRSRTDPLSSRSVVKSPIHICSQICVACDNVDTLGTEDGNPPRGFNSLYQTRPSIQQSEVDQYKLQKN